MNQSHVDEVKHAHEQIPPHGHPMPGPGGCGPNDEDKTGAPPIDPTKTTTDYLGQSPHWKY